MRFGIAAFFIFVWFFGMLFGSVFEHENLQTYHRAEISPLSDNQTMTTQNTFNYLFDFSYSGKETTIGSVFWKLMQPNYYLTWFSVLTLDFGFLKSIDPATGDTEETIWSYLFKAAGIVGIFCFGLMFIDVIQGFIPST